MPIIHLHEYFLKRKCYCWGWFLAFQNLGMYTDLPLGWKVTKASNPGKTIDESVTKRISLYFPDVLAKAPDTCPQYFPIWSLEHKKGSQNDGEHPWSRWIRIPFCFEMTQRSFRWKTFFLWVCLLWHHFFFNKLICTFTNFLKFYFVFWAKSSKLQRMFCCGPTKAQFPFMGFWIQKDSCSECSSWLGTNYETCLLSSCPS